MKTIGVDGCKSGWFAVHLTEKHWETAIHKNISSIWENRKEANMILIDIPIGFRKDEEKERLCDLEARKTLGTGRGSSVFPTPCRSAIYCPDYKTAHNENRKSIGRGLSQQTWGIVPKIREVDTFLRERKNAQTIVSESHPEVAFWALNGKAAMRFNKKTEDGLKERIETLEKYEKRARSIYQSAIEEYMRKEVGKDDIVDAICMAVTGMLIQKTEIKSLPQSPEIDQFGLPMQILYYGANV